MSDNATGAIIGVAFFAFLTFMTWSNAQVEISKNTVKAAELAASASCK